MSEARLRFALEPANVSRLLFGAIAVLGVVHLAAMAVYFGKLGPPSWNANLKYWHVMFFDLDAEESFSTWFNSGLLLAAAVLLLVQRRVSQATGDGLQRWWLVLAVGFFALSADEVLEMAGISLFVCALLDLIRGEGRDCYLDPVGTHGAGRVLGG